jgi:outer membrane protein TolC
MRWKKFVGGLALSLTAITGCKQPVFMTEADADKTLATVQLPKGIESDPKAGDVYPDLNGKITSKPADVYDPDRPVRFLSLADAIAAALENGTIGQPGSGLSNDTSSAFPIQQNARGLGYGAIDRDSIRVFQLDPANVYTDIEASLSKFDSHWVTSMSWNTTDRPVGTSLDQFQAAGTTNNIRTQAAEFTSSLVKPLPTGGVAAITFDNQYQFTNLPARVNPSYTPSVQFQFEQPLLQGFGVDINQIRSDHPGSILNGTQFQTQPRNAQEGIVLTRIRFDQTRADFEANVASMLLNVEIAYWNLYAAYGQLYAREIAFRKNLEIWRLTKERVEAGVKQFTPADLYESQGQYESSRSDWLGALGNVLESERNLRGLMGLKPEDNSRLVPSDQPTLAPFSPDWESGLQEALTLKPELVIEREQIKATQMHLIDMKNRLLPDLRFTSTYNVNGIGSRLDGADPNQNAFRDLAADRFNNWTLGLRLDVPIGYRDANAGLRVARLQLAQAYWSLRAGEDKVTRYLALQYRHVKEFQGQIQRNLAAMEAYNNELNVRIQRVKGGTDTPDVTLQAIRFGSAAMVLYYQFVGQYNASLANYEFAKGTLLRRDNVMITEGPLTGCPEVRAIEHTEAREKALILRERAAPLTCDGGACGAGDISPLKADMLSLPDWIKSRPPLPPDVNDALKPLPPPPPPSVKQMGSGTGTGAKLPASLPALPAAPVTLPPLPGPDLGSGPK